MIPLEECGRRREDRRAATARLRRTEERLGLARLAVFALIGVAIWLVAGSAGLPGSLLPVPIVGFVVVVVLHLRVISRRSRSLRAEAFYEASLARLEDRWAGTGRTGERFATEDHPYARDLDLFGEGSLFELLCTARTRAGEGALAAWLSNPAELDEVRARQEAVEELRPRLDLREEMALLGEEVQVGIHGDDLAAWGAAPPTFAGPGVAIASAALAAAAVVTFVLGMLDLGWLWFSVVVLAELTFALVNRRRIESVLASADRSAAELDLLSRMLQRVETERFEAERLRRIQATLAASGAPPSRRIARLRLLVQLVDARRNQIFAAIAAPLMWGTQLAGAIERWRRRSGAEVGRWIEAVGETEALLSLAGHAWERPDRPFPDLVDDELAIEGEELGHPLLPAATCVRNDLRFGDERRLFVVSGSNMSGKSTWLRTIGVNAVLALAGAPVRARRMRLSRLRVAASMRNQDSLQDGRSKFYAEIERLKAVVDLTEGGIPVLFLLDELLHGTNSHDRAVGGEAVVRELVERGAVGLITTHDLTLARIADSLASRAENVHFEDRIEDGRIAFDYRLRPGVVTKSNALELMRSIGLDV